MLVEEGTGMHVSILPAANKNHRTRWLGLAAGQDSPATSIFSPTKAIRAGFAVPGGLYCTNLFFTNSGERDS